MASLALIQPKENAIVYARNTSIAGNAPDYPDGTELTVFVAGNEQVAVTQIPKPIVHSQQFFGWIQLGEASGDVEPYRVWVEDEQGIHSNVVTVYRRMGFMEEPIISINPSAR
jgi:hypothetical protein